ncbi:hypothetical protein Taro_045023, partial [Colocasia esculenta]|nr:hypothetical protein [Colocasia esculenta]
RRDPAPNLVLIEKNATAGAPFPGLHFASNPSLSDKTIERGPPRRPYRPCPHSGPEKAITARVPTNLPPRPRPRTPSRKFQIRLLEAPSGVRSGRKKRRSPDQQRPPSPSPSPRSALTSTPHPSSSFWRFWGFGMPSRRLPLSMVEGGEAFVHASEDEVMEIEHLLADTKYENTLEDDITYLNSADTEKYLMLENFPCSDEFYGISNTETPATAESDGQCLDSMLQHHDKDQTLHVIGNLPDGCSDYIFDDGFAEKRSNTHYDLSSGYCLGNLSSEYPQILEFDSAVDETLDLTNTVNLRNDGTSDQNALHSGDINIREVHDTFRGTCAQCAPAVDKQQLRQCIMFGLNSLMDLDYSYTNSKTELLSDENEDMIILSTNNLSEISCESLTSALDQTISVGKSLDKKQSDKDAVTAGILGADRFSFVELEGSDHALVTRKRKRKPTRRYIEESSEVKSREYTGKFGSISTCPQEKILHIRAHPQWKKSVPAELIFSEDSSSLSNNQMLCDVQPQRGRPRKIFTCVGFVWSLIFQLIDQVKDLKGKRGHGHNSIEHKTVYGSILSESADEDGILGSPRTRSDKCGARRKHHRLWTLTEVTKLIEGVSRYGVGRWTDIKRLLFSSSAYRTSVDLKDKWRNLLRASGAHVHGKKDFETRKKHLPGQVPQSVLRRVRDLAIIHPYPRKRKIRLPLLRPASADEAEDTPCSNMKTVHR